MVYIRGVGGETLQGRAYFEEAGVDCGILKK